MILTVTLNAAVDKTYTVPGFSLDHVHRPNGWRIVAGGKGINVARVLKELGAETKATGFLGGHNGAYIQDSLNREGIPSDFIWTEGESRVCIAILDPEAATQTELNEVGPQITETELDTFLAKYDQLVRGCELVALSGSVPPGVRAGIYVEMIAIARKHGVRALLDTSGECLREGLHGRPFLLKPNINELSAVMGISNPNLAQVAQAANKVAANDVQWVIASLGRAGSVICHEGQCWHANAPEVRTVSAVGSGDALLAAWAYALTRGLPVEEAARLGSAAGAANAMSFGAGVCSREDIYHLAEQVHVKPLGEGKSWELSPES